MKQLELPFIDPYEKERALIQEIFADISYRSADKWARLQALDWEISQKLQLFLYECEITILS